MDIQSVYKDILEDLKLGGRALRRLNSTELKELETHLNEEKDPERLKEILCIVEHSASFHPPFEPILLKLLHQESDPEILVFALNAARKHILASHQQQGKRVEFSFLEVLQKLLYSKSPEVVEWTLRTIEEMGAQGIFFKKDLNNIKPAPWKWFNEHQRSVREIIAMLEHRWSEK